MSKKGKISYGNKRSFKTRGRGGHWKILANDFFLPLLISSTYKTQKWNKFINFFPQIFMLQTHCFVLLEWLVFLLLCFTERFLKCSLGHRQLCWALVSPPVKWGSWKRSINCVTLKKCFNHSVFWVSNSGNYTTFDSLRELTSCIYW